MRLRVDCLAKGEFGNGRQNKALRVGGALRILGRSYSSTHCRLLDPSTYDDIAGTRANQICGFRVRRCLSNTGPRERLGVHHRISRTLTTSPFSFLSKQTAKMLLSFLDVQLAQTGLGLRSGKRGHPHPAEQLHFPVPPFCWLSQSVPVPRYPHRPTECLAEDAYFACRLSVLLS